MTSTNGATTSRIARRFWLLGLGIVLFVAAYTAAWFYGANRLGNYVRTQMSEADVSLACSGLDVKGYPFRIGVFCDAIGVDDKRTGTSASFGALRSAAQVYRPGHAVLEIDGPAQIRVSPDLALTADWDLLHASAVAGTGGLERTSIAHDGIKGTFTAGRTDVNLAFSARHGEVHARRNDEALDIALSADGLNLNVSDTTMPQVDVVLDATIENAADWLNDGPPTTAPHGTKGELRNFSLAFVNGSNAALSGPYEVDDKGRLSGNFQVQLKGIDTVRDAVAEAFPEIAETASSVASTIRSLSGGKDEASVRLRVRDGVVYLGIIPLAAIPPL
ncbi:hypothetical protein SAMN05892877_111194 [Rhizobium subbaraonis]|uniref:DUF2125 domain-containing protein n=1 Tax=Rhizobium subbaraonis TaxID=908946 RepID=A0A285UPD3_9HYPH|nr:DUF2125 domain-containing protein [Rhizobium subbaraonis]SOC43679.1 hypothetical protein SAMN05892877_111194 [Rhizobium subbaraonis]